jgi:hypothetical protein
MMQTNSLYKINYNSIFKCDTSSLPPFHGEWACEWLAVQLTKFRYPGIQNGERDKIERKMKTIEEYFLTK